MRAGGGCHGVAAAICELCVTPRFGGCGRATAAQKRAVAHAHRKFGRPGVGAPVPEGMSHSGARRCGRRGVERQFRRERALGSDCAHGVTLARARDAGLGFRLRGRRRAGAQGRKHHHDVRTASPGGARRE
ncbi:hypothetical protein ERJ75_001567600 [Trypanosoma vivax]|nr:hypothetical protein ERJ75_001567600 [Trypanosoma vivax]